MHWRREEFLKLMQTMTARSFVTLFCNGNMLVPTVTIRSNTAKLENLFCYILANMYSLTTRKVWFVTNDNQENKICLLIKKNTKQRNQILCRMVINITADMPTWIRLQVKQHQTWNTRINRNSDRVISTCKYRNNDVQSVRGRVDHGHLSGELDNFILIISCKLIWEIIAVVNAFDLKDLEQHLHSVHVFRLKRMLRHCHFIYFWVRASCI